MMVSEVMHQGVNTVQIHDSIRKVASIMKKYDIGAVPVFKNERAVGFATDRDIVVSALAHGHPPEAPISQAMTRDLYSIFEDDSIEKAAEIMQSKKISRLLVVNHGNDPVGMISLHDITNYIEDTELKANIITQIKKG